MRSNSLQHHKTLYMACFWVFLGLYLLRHYDSCVGGVIC